jgi:hypothetical protein
LSGKHQLSDPPTVPAGRNLIEDGREGDTVPMTWLGTFARRVAEKYQKKTLSFRENELPAAAFA